MDLPIGFLVLPPACDRSVATLRRKLALTLLHALLTARPVEAGRSGASLKRVQAFLETVLRGRHKKALITTLEKVDVLVPLLAAKGGISSLSDALEMAMPALLIGFARGVPSGQLESVLWDAPVIDVFDASSGRLFRCAEPAHGLGLTASGAELRLASGEKFDLLSDAAPPKGVHREDFLHALSDATGPALSMADSNPLFSLEEHPEKTGNQLDLGDRPIEEWVGALRAALGLIEETLPGLSEELLGNLERIVPVGYEPERHYSASYREGPGLIYLTLHPSTLTMAEAIVHESQHGKLNLLRWFDPLLENGESVWTQSEVRPDLRPLNGVLLAVHAFVPVAALHYRLDAMRHPLAETEAFRKRRRQVLAANGHGLETLNVEGQATELGARVLAGLRELQAFLVEACPGHSAPGDLEQLG